MELPLTYNYSKLNNVTITNENGSSCIHYVQKPSIKLINFLQDFTEAKVTTKSYNTDEFNNLLTELYSNQAEEYDLDDLSNSDLQNLASSIAPSEDILDDANEGPIIKLINATIAKAIKARASDIHLEPFENFISIRFRVDGVLSEVLQYQSNISQMITSRIKIMSKLDISERRLPQDGRISISLGRREIDLRVSTLPSSFGERIVLRILEKGATNISLDDLGFNEDVLKTLRNSLSKTEGIVLVTGPTGSGKTTTLYAGLKEISNRQQNILTIEDPVEYALDGIGQTQVNTKTGLTFAKGLRAILRQDPDIVMVGEIRDKETAEIAIQASLTGHLVLSTVHTNSAVSAITRLRDMGIEPYLISSSLLYVLAQRLVRRLCEHCKEIEDNKILLEPHKLDGKAYKPKGCNKCDGTGYFGRVSIGEFIKIDKELSDLIYESASENKIARHVYKNNLTLFSNGINAVSRGLTSLAEIFRISDANE